jgi:hypothetical protein
LKQFALRGRDPAVADDNLYRYCGDEPTEATDPSGLAPGLVDAKWGSGSPGVKWSGVAFVINYTFSKDLANTYESQVINYTFSAKDSSSTEIKKYSGVGKIVDLAQLTKDSMSDRVNTQREDTPLDKEAFNARFDNSVCSMQVSDKGVWQFYKDKPSETKDGKNWFPFDPSLQNTSQIINTFTLNGVLQPQAAASSIVGYSFGSQTPIYQFSWTSLLTLSRKKPGTRWSGAVQITFEIPNNPALAASLARAGIAWNTPENPQKNDMLFHKWNK